MEATKRARPVPGTVTTKTIRIPVCSQCGYRIDDFSLCSGDCGYDDNHEDPSSYFYAVYEVTDKFIGDEPAPASEAGPNVD